VGETSEATQAELERRKRKISLEIFIEPDPEDPSKDVMKWDMMLDGEHKTGQTVEEMGLIVYGAHLALQEIAGVGLLSVQVAKRNAAMKGNGGKIGGLYKPGVG
jgi:hypothetical protein